MENNGRNTLFITAAGELQENTFYGRRTQPIIGVHCCLGALFFSYLTSAA
jgi:hypothetical protein